MKNWQKISLFFIGIILGIVLLSNRGYKKFNSEEEIINDSTIVDDSIIKLDGVVVYKKLLKYKIKHPKIVMQQILLETGHLTSNICKKNNNLFGFHNGKNYLSFNNYEESIIYYKKWQGNRYKKGDYYLFLDSVGYAKDSNYINVLKRIKIDV